MRQLQIEESNAWNKSMNKKETGETEFIKMATKLMG